MSSSIASSSRTISRIALAPIGIQQIRTVIHHARPPRIPILNSPHQPKTQSPTPGTSTPQATESHPIPSSSSIELESAGLTFHHAPPPTAPSYTTGAIPPFLQWVNGQSVHLTGEEVAPRRKERRGDGEGVVWDGGLKKQIIEMRARGQSRGEIAKSLSIPAVHEQRISRLASLTPEQKSQTMQALQDQKSTWGFNKRLARAKRERRKELW